MDKSKSQTEEPQLADLEIEELEEISVPVKVACGTSSCSCGCTSSSCVVASDDVHVT